MKLRVPRQSLAGQLGKLGGRGALPGNMVGHRTWNGQRLGPHAAQPTGHSGNFVEGCLPSRRSARCRRHSGRRQRGRRGARHNKPTAIEDDSEEPGDTVGYSNGTPEWIVQLLYGDSAPMGQTAAVGGAGGNQPSAEDNA